MDFQSILRSKRMEAFAGTELNRINLSCFNGCKYNCRYCQAKVEAIRSHMKKTGKDWEQEEALPEELKREYHQEAGVYVFPAAHDIHPENMNAILPMLSKILAAGNRVIITTKPDYDTVKKICAQFERYRSAILFRFSMGSVDSGTLKVWEPHAPSFEERLEALKWAYYCGFNTGVVCEPMLDNKVDQLIAEVRDWVTEAIWLGIINLPLSLVKKDPEIAFYARQLVEWQSPENIRRLYREYMDNPHIKWNWSIEELMRPLPKENEV